MGKIAAILPFPAVRFRFWSPRLSELSKAVAKLAFRNYSGALLFLCADGARQEDGMDRRLFLTTMLGIAGTAAIGATIGPRQAIAGIPVARDGILDELDTSDADLVGDDTDAQVELVRDRHDGRRPSHRRHDRHHRRRHRRRVWKRFCSRVWRHGRRVTRCQRRRVWVWA